MISERSNDRRYHFTHRSRCYKRLSCRICEAELIVPIINNVCKEPILWHCEKCYIACDSIHHQHSYIETSDCYLS